MIKQSMHYFLKSPSTLLMIIIIIGIRTGKPRIITQKVALIKDTHCFNVNSAPILESKVNFAI